MKRPVYLFVILLLTISIFFSPASFSRLRSQQARSYKNARKNNHRKDSIFRRFSCFTHEQPTKQKKNLDQFKKSDRSSCCGFNQQSKYRNTNSKPYPNMPTPQDSSKKQPAPTVEELCEKAAPLIKDINTFVGSQRRRGNAIQPPNAILAQPQRGTSETKVTEEVGRENHFCAMQVRKYCNIM